jgi:hypothetical protein
LQNCDTPSTMERISGQHLSRYVYIETEKSGQDQSYSHLVHLSCLLAFDALIVTTTVATLRLIVNRHSCAGKYDYIFVLKDSQPHLLNLDYTIAGLLFLQIPVIHFYIQQLLAKCSLLLFANSHYNSLMSTPKIAKDVTSQYHPETSV